MLDIGDGVKPKNVLEEVKELSELLGTTSSHGASASGGSKKFQGSHPEDFSPDQTVVLPQQTGLTMMDCQNSNLWKGQLPHQVKEGVLYSDDDFEITVQTQVIKYLVRLMLTFKSKDPLCQVSDISLKLMNPAFY